MSISDLEEEFGDATRTVTRHWWLPILIGVLWLVYGFVVLSANTASIAAVSLLFGFGFIAGGIIEFAVASVVVIWRWLHIIAGIISIIAGITSVVWPGETFVVIAAILGWYLLFDGVFQIVSSISARVVTDLWWLGLILGAAEIAIAVWAMGYTGRSVALLLVWVAVAAIGRGISNITIGLTLHGADRQLRAAMNR